jgi:hypothetical protein
MNIWEQSFEDLRRPHLEEKKGDGNLANNYPPYDKVTRGDVIAGATGKDQMGGKKKMMKKEHSDWRSDLGFFIEEDCGSGPMKPKKGIKNKVTINPDLKTEESISEFAGLAIKAGLAAGTALAGKAVYDKAKDVAGKMQQRNQQTQKAINQLRNSFEAEGKEISEREMTSGEMKKEKTLKKKYDDSGMKASMKKQYGAEKGKQVYFATIRKQAMEQFAGNYEGPLYAPHPELVEKKNDSYLETDMKKRQKNNEKAIADMKKTKAHNDMVKAARKHFEEIENELDYYLGEALRPASERMKRTQTAVGRKKQEQERTKKSKLEAEADKILAGFSRKGTGLAKTKPMSERREMDEPGESDTNPDVKRHNKAVGYKSKSKRPSIANDPRYGTVRDSSGKWKY